MEQENLDIENITETRRSAIAKSIREISINELKSVADSLLNARHTWIDPLFQLIEEDAGNTFFHAKANDRIEIIYCRAKEKGIWFIRGTGLGYMLAKDLNIVKEIVDSRSR